MFCLLAAPSALVLALNAPPAPLAAPAAPRAVEIAAGTLWAPPERSKKPKKAVTHPKAAAPSDDDDTPPPTSSRSTNKLERDVFGGGAAAAPTPKVRKEAKKDDRDEAAEDDDDEDAPVVRRRARPVRSHEVEEQDAEAPSAPSLPVVAPRFVWIGVGAALVGRRFGFDAPLQQERTFGRIGTLAMLEAFPLLPLRGWYSKLGLGATVEKDFGNAQLTQMDGSTLGFPVSDVRWSIDARYALPLGDHVVLVPTAGYGHASYDIERKTETTPPSMCGTNATQICLPDVALSHFTLGVDTRVAFTQTFGMSLGLAFLPAFGVGRGAGQIGAEAAPSAMGYGGELAATWLVQDWLALRASVPLVHYGFSFSGGTNLPYKSASETYYGTVIGATVFTN
jgi:hypothetical protein